MTLFPDVQKRAQAEIDTIVGQDRLPNYQDREHLPYIEVLVQEVLRFFSVVPIGKKWQNSSFCHSKRIDDRFVGIPHVSLADDVHDGYFIPKGAIIFQNLWSVLFFYSPYCCPISSHLAIFQVDVARS